MKLGLLDLELTYWPIISSYLLYKDTLSLSLTHRNVLSLYQENYNQIYHDYISDHKAIVNEILYLEYNNTLTINTLSYDDTNSICRRLQGLDELSLAKWNRWDFHQDDDPNDNNTDTEGNIFNTST
jgi:hypothetical protein